MKVLAVDSSGLVASVALVTEEGMVAEYTMNHKKTHSQTLMPMLDEIVRMAEQELSDIDAIATAAGPGSFTGLRIGAAMVKGLGLALNKPVIGVPTVDALAYNLYDTKAVICPMMDARRKQVYTGLYEFKEHKLAVIEEQMAIGVEEILEKINVLGREVIFLGDGVPVYEEMIQQGCKVSYSIAPPHLSRQRAGAVGSLALQYVKEGRQMETAGKYKPEYLRLSQAERERLEKEGKMKA